MSFWTNTNVVTVRDALDFDKEALKNNLTRNIPAFLPTDILRVRQFGHGQSNPTFLLEIESSSASPRRYVLRKKPPGKILRSAHAVEREFKVLEAVGKHNLVPVPKVICLCTDDSVIGTPFYIMEHVEGRIFTDPNLPGLSPSERSVVYSQVAKTMALLHMVDVTAVGLDKFGQMDNYCRRQVETWSRQFKASTVGLRGPDPARSMSPLIEWLKSNIPHEDGQGTSMGIKGIVHGDFRLDNLIFHPKQLRVIAVLDWELSTLGNQMSDLAYCCMVYHLPTGFHQVPALDVRNGRPTDGIPSQAEFVAEYCREAGVHWPSTTWTFYMALSLFRAAAIFSGVYKRALQGNASSPTAIQTGVLVGQLADRALHIIHAQDSLGQRPMHSLDTPVAGFEIKRKVRQLRQRLVAFMENHVYPNEAVLNDHARGESRWTIHPLVEELKKKAKEQGLWNLWIPVDSAALASKLLKEAEAVGAMPAGCSPMGLGLSNLEYAPLCEIMGRSLWAPEIFNCSAPDTGNMEVLLRYGSPAQQRQWLLPLLAGDIRSCFTMTEPDVASSDATNIRASITRDGDSYILNGRKWWASGAMDPRCRLAIFMGKTSGEAKDRSSMHEQQSMILVDMKSAGLKVLRPLDVFGYDDAPHGHAEVDFQDVRVPAGNILWGEGRGFDIAQGRLGPGRLHHCMRLVGAAQRGLEAMAQRGKQRRAFGRSLASHGAFTTELAECRLELEGARLLVLNAAHQLDLHGNRAARAAVAMAKVAAPRAALKVLDTAIQAHGAAGVCSDFPLAHLWAMARTLRIADGPDQVHLGTIAKEELRARM